MKNINKKIEDALYKRALGYELVETTEEFVKQEEDLVLNKRKVNKKDIAPDINALKLLISYLDINDKSLDSMTTEELIKEKEKLKNILEEYKDIDL